MVISNAFEKFELYLMRHVSRSYTKKFNAGKFHSAEIRELDIAYKFGRKLKNHK